MTETAKITARDFKALVRQKMAPAMGDPQLFRTRLQEILSFAIANEASMDAEANSYFDSLLTMMADMLEDGLGKIADSPEKRKLLRSVALTKRKHHSAEGFLKGLGRTLPTPFAVAEVAKPVFLGVLQSVLDLLFDATRQPQSGVAQFAILSLLYWTVDELTVAFYLAERKYTTQSYSHLRSVYDLLDTAELFFLQPQWAEVWGTGDRRKILKELSPGAVRKKLGKPKFDATYSFLTEMGMHGTFAAVRRRVVQRGRKENRPQVAMGLGVFLGTAKLI